MRYCADRGDTHIRYHADRDNPHMRHYAEKVRSFA